MLKTLMPGNFMGRLPVLVALIALIAFAAPELRAQQINPTDSAVQEEQLMQRQLGPLGRELVSVALALPPAT